MKHFESMSKETLRRKYDALPLDIRDGVEAFWEAGYDYDDPDFWDSFDPAPDPAFVEAVKMYDARQR